MKYIHDTNGTKKTKHIMAGGSMVATLETTVTTTTPYYLATDHLGGMNVTTSQTGVVQELTDYYPYGSIRLDDKASSFTEQRKYIGEEYDTDTGLNYLNARYYNGTLGRFISQDLLAIEALQITDQNKFAQIISNPQYWNTYSYALNNPLTAIDPSGLLTITIPGTWHSQKEWNNSEINTWAAQTFNETPVVFSKDMGWSNDDNKQARSSAVDALLGYIKGYTFADGEKLNIIAHSHGGNIAAMLSQRLDRKIDNLVTYNTPARFDYSFNEDNIGRHVNIYTIDDPVQQWGGGPFHMWFGDKAEFGLAGRKIDDDRVVNKNMTLYSMFYKLTHPIAQLNPFSSHSYLRKSEWVWNHAVEPNVIK